MKTAQHHTLDRLLSYLAQDPHNTSLLCDSLHLAIELNELSIAQQLLTHGQSIHCESMVFMGHAVYVLLCQGSYQDAALVGELALSRGNTDIYVRRNTAYAFFYTQQYAQTAALLDLEESPQQLPIDLQLMYARALHHLEREQDAIDLLMIAKQTHGQHAELWGLLALLLDAVEHSEAKQHAKHALAIDPTQRDALLAMADIYLTDQEEQQAAQYYQQLLDVHPQSGRAWAGLAQIAFAQMELSSAQKLAEQALDYMVDHIGTWHILAWCLIMRTPQDLPTARHAIEKAYALDRNFAETHGALAVLDALEQRIDQAELSIRRALKLNPQCWSAHYAKVILLQQAGQQQQAQQLIDQTLNHMAPNSVYTGRDLVHQWVRKHGHRLNMP